LSARQEDLHFHGDQRQEVSQHEEEALKEWPAESKESFPASLSVFFFLGGIVRGVILFFKGCRSQFGCLDAAMGLRSA
jgi:hypothetical protein